MELLTNQQMGLADRLTITTDTDAPRLHGSDGKSDSNRLTEFELLCNAGRAVAQHILSRYANCNRVLVLCGPGNNGGDGLIAARVLSENGFSVRVVSLGSLASSAVVQQAQQFWGGAIEQSAADDSQLTGINLVVDAMFGAGLSRALQGEAAAWVQLLNEHRQQAPAGSEALPVVSIDVPSGLNADTGEPVGVAVQAMSTVTFFREKPGHILCPGRQLCGDTEVMDIGINPSVLQEIQPTCYHNKPALWCSMLPVTSVSQHKFHRGHTLVYCGPVHATGAARLSARAALRAGSGLVTLATPVDAVAVVAAQVTAVMIAPWKTADDAVALLSDTRINSVVIGPAFGVGKATCELILTLLGADSTSEPRSHSGGNPAVVLDADALTSFADHCDELFAAIAEYDSDVVLTPHDGEYARLFNCSGSRLARARWAAQQSGAIVVLKGPDTVVAAPDGRASINDNAPPTLATAGAGDVLAGIIAALMAQGMEGFVAASAAVWLHGQCAASYGAGLIAEDIPEQLPQVLSTLQQPDAPLYYSGLGNRESV